MATVTMDAAAVRALAERVRLGADRLEEVPWPTALSTELAGAEVAVATAGTPARDLLADVVGRMRAWAAAVDTAVTAVERADSNHAARLGGAL